MGTVWRWWRGIRKVSHKQARSLNLVKAKGILLEVVPSRDAPDLRLLPSMIGAVYRPHRKRLLKKMKVWKSFSSNSFEIAAYRGSVSFFIWSKDVGAMQRVVNGLNLLYPNCQTRWSRNPLFPICEGDYVCHGAMNVPILKGIKDLRDFEIDPLNYLVGILSKLPDRCMIQVFFKTMEPSRRLEKRLSKEKFKRAPMFEVLVRYVAVARTPKQAYWSARSIEDALKHLERDPKERRWEDNPFRSSMRTFRGMAKRSYPRLWGEKFLLTPGELATLVHLPSGYKGRGLLYAETSLIPPPPGETKKRKDILIGNVFYRGRRLERLHLSVDDVMRGQYIVGGSGTGKTALMINEALQAFRKGLCVHVLDPHGDMSYDILRRITPKEKERVFLLDPVLVGYSLNPFEIPGGDTKRGVERDLVVERLIGEITETMKKLFGKQYWGPALNRTFQNAARMLYRDEDNPTFVEIYQMIKGQGEIAQREHIKPFVREIRALPIERIDAVLNKLDPFVKNRLLRSIFCNKKSTVDFSKLIKPGQLVLWRLAKGELSETNMSMIGSCIVTKMWYHVASRGMKERVPLVAVIDEFQLFAALETLDSILTEGRKFKMGLILAHQSVKQIPMEVFRVALGNTSVKTIFRVSGEDGMVLARTLNPERAQLIRNLVTNLPDGSAVVKLKSGFGERSIPAFQIATNPLPEESFHDVKSIIQRMRDEFRAPVLGEAHVKEEAALSPEVYDLLRIVHWLAESGGEPNVGNTLMEFRKLYSGMRGSRLSQITDIAQSYGLVTRNIVKQKRGRPKIILKLTEKGMKEGLAMGTGSGASTKGGGELHRAMTQKMAGYLRHEGCLVEFEEQGGRAEQPDLKAWVRSKDGERWERELAFEFETGAKHPEQVRKNFEKNVKAGREVIFIVPDKSVKEKVERILGDYLKSARVEVIEDFKLR